MRLLRETVQTRLNLEMAATPEMLAFAIEIAPDMVTLVPEKREEQTTEGGLDVTGNYDALEGYLDRLRACGAHLSLFIDPDEAQIEASAELGVDIVEIHTGDYCEASDPFGNRAADGAHTRRGELLRLSEGAKIAARMGLIVAAGHGLDYKNVLAVSGITEFEEFNIGHSIVSRASLVGMERAVREMIEALHLGRSRLHDTL